MTVIGIDPGLDGAVVVLGYPGDQNGVHDGRPFLLDTPTLTVKGAKGNKREYHTVKMAAFLRPLAARSVAYIEKVHSMPGQGVRSMFSMGVGLGVWLGILAGLEIPVTLVTPQRWKGVMLDGMGHDKDAGRLRAMQLLPTQAELFERKKDDGRADAYLIAEYGRRLG